MNMLDKVLTQTSDQVYAKIRELDLHDYGVYKTPIADAIDSLKAENPYGKIVGIVAALNNADTDGVLLEILKTDPEAVFDGMKIIAYAAGAKSLTLNLPAFAENKYEEIKTIAENNGIFVETGLVNKRAAKGSLIVHIVAALETANAFYGKQEKGVYLSVNGAPLKKYSDSTSASDLLPGEITAVRSGYRMLTPDALGASVGSLDIENGVLSGITSDKCVIAAVEDELLKSRRQSCGKCVFCREGLVQLEGMHRDIVQGKGKTDYIDITSEIGDAMTFSTPCSMGQKASEIALSSVENFRTEYDEHIRRRKCRANACTAFINIYVDPMTCSGCGECIKVCPLDCIDGRPGYIHSIDDYDCTKCGKCIEACPEKSIIETTKRLPRLPSRVTRVGKFKRHF